jgi:glucose repression mediator protein
LAWAAFRQDKVEECLEYITQADFKKPGQADNLYIKGRCYMAKNDLKKALNFLQEAAFKYPGEVCYWTTLSMIYFMQGEFSDSFENIIKATSLNTKISDVWYNLGILYETCKQPNEALVAYEKAQDIQPGEPISLERINAIN